MLVLTRKPRQSIIIEKGDEKGDIKIEVVVIEIRGDQVRLGIKAPREVEVHRKEIYERIHGEERARKKA